MIFIRKQFFAGQDKKSQLGLIISTHVIKETQLMSYMDVDRFVFKMFNTKTIDENTLCILDLFIYNMDMLKNLVCFRLSRNLIEFRDFWKRSSPY